MGGLGPTDGIKNKEINLVVEIEKQLDMFVNE